MNILVTGGCGFIDSEYFEFIEDRPWNDKRYFITNDKIKFLGWKQSISFVEGLMDMI